MTTDIVVPPEFLKALGRFPDGYMVGVYAGGRWGSTIRRSSDGRRTWLFSEELGGTNVVSFNIFALEGNRSLLRPCEMSSQKVIDFVLGYRATVS